MNTYIKEYAVLLSFTVMPLLSISQVITYRSPKGVRLIKDYTVTVKSAQGNLQKVDCYPAKVVHYDNYKGKAENTSFGYFDFKGNAEVTVTYNNGPVKDVRIRPASFGIKPIIKGNQITFSISEPRNLSIEVNGDLYHNLQLFAGEIQGPEPNRADTNLIYYGPGIHYAGKVKVASGKTVYISGGAIVKGSFSIFDVKNVRITGRGIITQMDDFDESHPAGANASDEKGTADMIRVGRSENVSIEGITVLPRKYSIVLGESKKVKITDFRSFSQEGWGDGIDIFGSSDIEMKNLYMRNSDDCIAIYATRKEFKGSSKNISLSNSILWPDIAHPILIGTHGNTPNPDEISEISISNIDILNEFENQIDYQGCLSLNAGDGNLLKNIRFEDIRIENIRKGQLFNIRVMNNAKYNTSPGKGIENVYFKNISYTGDKPNLSIISGYDATRGVKNITFENLKINGITISDDMPEKPGYYKTGDISNIFIGEHVSEIKFIK